MKKDNRFLKFTRTQSVKKTFYFVLVILVLLAAWWIAAETAFRNNPIVPSPPEVFAALGKTARAGRLWISVWNTFFKSFLGFIVSFVLGTASAVLARLFVRVKYCVDPVVTIIRAFPTLAATYLLLMYLRTEETAVIVGALMVFPIFYTELYAALEQIDKKVPEMAAVYRVPLSAKIFTIYIPGIAPHLFSAAVAAFALNLKVVIAAEIVGGIALNTVGNFMSIAGEQLDYASMFAWVLAAIMLAFVSEAVIRFIMRLCLPSRYPTRKRFRRFFAFMLRRKKVTSKAAEKSVPAPAENFAVAPRAAVFDAVRFGYPNAKIFEDFSARFEPDRIHCIMGASGAGKTSLLHLAAGLVRPESGTIAYAPDSPAPKISYMFQEPRLIAEKTVLQNLMPVLLPVMREKGKKRRTAKAEARARAMRYLDAVGLSEKAHAYPGELSGGMAQRAALARAFAVPSDVLLMDEPFKGLDYALKKSVTDLFLSLLANNPRTVLWVTHDADEALLFADQIRLLTKISPARGLTALIPPLSREARKLSDKALVEMKERIINE